MKNFYSKTILSGLLLLGFATTGFTQTPPPFIEAGLPGNAFAGVVPAPNGRLYGLTYSGGTSNKGTLYSVDSALSAVVIHVNFNGSNGAVPFDELTYDVASAKFYGTTSSGGAGNIGTIFSFDPTTNALVTLKDDFLGYTQPQGPLVLSGGFLYGALSSPNGAVFRMAIDGSGFTILHSFTDFSAHPLALALGQDGKLYGATIYGGIVCDPNYTFGCGTVFRLRAVLPGDPNLQFETLYQIQDRFDANPLRRPVYGSDGLLYFNNHLRILRLDPNNPASTFQRIWEETGGSVSMSIIEGADNRLYAASYDNFQSRAGRIFSINRDGTGAISLRNFSFTTGSTAYGPYGTLYRSPSGIIYGTTEYTNLVAPFNGTVFAIGLGTSNTPPVLSNVLVTSPIIENGTATLTGNIIDPNAGDTFTLTVNWGDGSVPQVFNYAAGTTSFSVAHQYLDDNPSGTAADNYTINLTLADSNSGSDTDSAIVTVNNAAPVLSNIIATPATLIVGGTINLGGNVNDVGSLDTHEIVIDWKDGSPNTALNLAAGVNFFNANHQYNASGNFNITVTATDDDTGSTSGGTSITVNPPNDPPVLSNISVTSPIIENGTATLTGNIADPNAGNTFTLTVNWGDGTLPQILNYAAGTNSFNVTHQYLDDNPTATPSDNYTINLLLADNAGGSDTDSAGVTVNNAAPTLSNITVNPSTITIGFTTNLSGNVNDAGTQDSHQVVISWGDGSPNTTLNLVAGVVGFNTSHQYNAAGVFNIGITATDDDTGSVSGGASVTVNPSTNTPPVLSNVSVTSPINESGTATLSGNIADPNAGDTFTLTVNWGDGSPAQTFNYPAGTTSFSAAHQYRDDNPSGTAADNYTINLLLSDNAGGSDIRSTVVTVNNVAPTLSGLAANPSTIPVGGTITLSGNVNDVGTLDTHQVVINWGDGSPATTLNLAAGVTAFNANHQYNATGNFSIIVTATDDDTASVTGSTSITVTSSQQPPVLGNVAVSSPINENGTATLTGSISDPNPGDRFTLTVNWGDGTPVQVFNYPARTTSFSQTHQYADDNPSGTPSDNYLISLLLNDSAGGSDTRSTVVTVNNLSPTLNVRAPNPQTIVIGGTTALSGTVNDVGTLDPHTVVINWGDGSPSTVINLAAGVTAFNSNHQYNATGVFNIDVTATDDDTGSATGGASVTVTPPQKIAFVSTRDGNSEIYVMNVDGTNQTRLTNNPAEDLSPAISRDGSKIVFASTRDGNSEIYVMNADGTNQTRLTNRPTFIDTEPSFSADGSKIVFISNLDIYVMNADGSNLIQLTNDPYYEDYQPKFSPDGSRIVFATRRDYTSLRFNAVHIYVMNADGTGLNSLTYTKKWDLSPIYSPDGNRIAFASNRKYYPLLGGDRYDIYLMNSNGTNQIRLTTSSADEFTPSFSPDGSRIVFSTNRDGNSEIYVMNSDGSNLIRLTNNPAEDSSPSWGG